MSLSFVANHQLNRFTFKMWILIVCAEINPHKHNLEKVYYYCKNGSYSYAKLLYSVLQVKTVQINQVQIMLNSVPSQSGRGSTNRSWALTLLVDGVVEDRKLQTRTGWYVLDATG